MLGNLGLLAEGKINKKIHAQDVDLSACIHTCSSAALHAGHADVKAIIDQEIAQEIARLEAKIDAVISKLMLDSEFASTQCLDRSRCQYNLQSVNVDKRLSGRQVNSANDNPELRLEDLSRQIAQLRKGQQPLCSMNEVLHGS